MKVANYLFMVAALAARAQGSEVPTFEMSLSVAVEQAHERSNSLKAASSSVEASRNQVTAARAPLLPNLSIQGTYFYQKEVASIAIGPVTQAFGTNNNYAVGPVLSYTVFDGLKSWKNLESADLNRQAGEKRLAAQERQLELAVRQAYFRVQYALRQLVLTSDSLKLSIDQSRDIDLREKAGSSSRLDQLQARQDATTGFLRYQQAQRDLSNAFHDFLELIGEAQKYDASRPVPRDLLGNVPRGAEAPTLVVQLDSLESSLGGFSGARKEAAGARHPEIAALELQAAASGRSADAEAGGLYPRIELQAREQYQYPNFVLPETTWQTVFAASVSFPLFEGSASRARAAERSNEGQSISFQKEQRLEELDRDFKSSADSVKSLEDERTRNKQNVTEAREVQSLTYKSYQAGKVRYLDVQNANFKLLQAEVTEAQIESELLSQLAILEYLANP